MNCSRWISSITPASLFTFIHSINAGAISSPAAHLLEAWLGPRERMREVSEVWDNPAFREYAQPSSNHTSSIWGKIATEIWSKKMNPGVTLRDSIFQSIRAGVLRLHRPPEARSEKSSRWAEEPLFSLYLKSSLSLTDDVQGETDRGHCRVFNGFHLTQTGLNESIMSSDGVRQGINTFSYSSSSSGALHGLHIQSSRRFLSEVGLGDFSDFIG